MDGSAKRSLSVCFAAVTAVILCLPVYALVGAVEAAEDQQEETVLRAGFMQWVDSLNPNLGLTDAAYVFYGLVYDTTHTVENDFDIIGNLATSWRMVPETDPELVASGEPLGSVWEYNITPNARWHDGNKLTVDDIEWTVNLQAKNYDTMWAYQPYAYFMNYAEAVDEDTIRIHYYDRDTGDPVPASYAYLLCIPALPKHKLGGQTPGYVGFEWDGVFEGEEFPIVGTGPFTGTSYIWEEYSEGNQITLVKNEAYHWEKDRGIEINFDKIVMKFYDDASGMLLDLKKGELDIAQFPPQTYLALKGDIDDGSVQDIEYFDGIKCTQYWTEIAINYAETSAPGTNNARLDPAVRQAMAIATDKDFIVDTFYAGLADPGTTLISPVNTKWHYAPTADELYDFDKDAASALLEEAGYTDSSGDGIREATADSMAVEEGWCAVGTPLQFDMMIRREYPEEKEIAAYLEQVWEEVGIDLEFEVVDEVTLATEVYQYQYDTMIWYWSADADPNYMLFCQAGYSIGGWNDNCYDNQSYNEAYFNSVVTLDETQRKVYTDECQRVNYLDAYYIILAYPYQTYAWRTDTFEGWGDWEANPCLSFDHFWTGPQLLFQLTPLDPEPKGGGIDATVLAAVGAAAAIVIAAVIAVLLMMKKKGGKKEKEEKVSTSPLGE